MVVPPQWRLLCIKRQANVAQANSGAPGGTFALNHTTGVCEGCSFAVRHRTADIRASAAEVTATRHQRLSDACASPEKHVESELLWSSEPLCHRDTGEIERTCSEIIRPTVTREAATEARLAYQFARYLGNILPAAKGIGEQLSWPAQLKAAQGFGGRTGTRARPSALGTIRGDHALESRTTPCLVPACLRRPTGHQDLLPGARSPLLAPAGE